MVTIFVVGLIWDYFATWRRHWISPGDGLVGFRILGLPIEEYLFFLVMGYWALTVYRILESKYRRP